MTSRHSSTIARLATLLAVAVLASLAVAGPAAAEDEPLPTAGTFTADLKVSQPTGTAPASGTELTYPADAIDLTWDPVAGATHFQVQIALLPDEAQTCSGDDMVASLIVVNVVVAAPRYVPSLVDDGSRIWTGGYCWRVRAVVPGATGSVDSVTVRGTWSTPSTFNRRWSSTPTGLYFFNDEAGVTPRPIDSASSCATPSTNSPDYSTECVTRVGGYLRWSVVNGASSYDIQVSGSDSFAADDGSVVLDLTRQKTTRLALPRLPDDSYRWRVRAVGPDGQPGEWAEGQQFRVRWFDATWNDDANVSPAYDSTLAEVTVGWTPARGASYYQVQMATTPGCFWTPTGDQQQSSGVPGVWGSWVKDSPYTYDDVDPPIVYPSKPRADQCRLSTSDFTTINNWATLDSLWDPKVFENIANDDCWKDSTNVTCFDAGLPTADNGSGDWGTGMDYNVYNSAHPGVADRKSIEEVLQSTGLYPAGISIYWRVRPVYELSSSTQTGWTGGATKVYGRWLEHYDTSTNPNTVVPLRFQLDLADAPTSAGTRCAAGTNPTTNKCLVMDSDPLDSNRPTRMQAGPMPADPSEDDDSASMQMPLMTWNQFPGLANPSYAGGYILQISREPDFNTTHLVRQVFLPFMDQTRYGWQNSYAPTDSLPDNDVQSGYWWRVVPCELSDSGIPLAPSGVCTPLYYEASGGIYTEFTDGAGAQSFTKRSSLTTEVSLNFAGTLPRISWYRTGVSSIVDKARGINGADHYEVAIARSRFFVGATTYLTTVPYWVPPSGDGQGSSGQATSLEDGAWFFRVRAVDRTGRKGAWSSAGSFTKITPAPTRTSSLKVSADAPVVRWAPVDYADSYEVQVSRASDFDSDGVHTVTSRQVAVAPLAGMSASAGTWYWRVRAIVAGNAGRWSAVSDSGPTITDTSSQRIHSAVSATSATAGETLYVKGLLLDEDGVGMDDERIDLYMTDAACNVDGAYSYTGQHLQTSAAGEEGTVRFRVEADQNRCYRMRWADPVQAGRYIYSAPIPVKVSPGVTLTIPASSVVRRKNFAVRVYSNVPLTGLVKVQFKYQGRWVNLKSLQFNNQRASSFYGQINYAGRFATRVVFYSMRSCLPASTCGGYQTFEDVTAAGRTIRVNDLFSVYTSRR